MNITKHNENSHVYCFALSQSTSMQAYCILQIAYVQYAFLTQPKIITGNKILTLPKGKLYFCKLSTMTFAETFSLLYEEALHDF